MSLTSAFVIGFIVGVGVAALSFLIVLARYKWESLRSKAQLKDVNQRNNQTDRRYAEFRKKMMIANAETEYLKGEVDRLRNEKLDAWGIPDSLDK